MDKYIIHVVNAPSVEPVTLTEVKQHLRVTEVDLDSAITSYIKSAREYIESYLDRSLVQQTIRLSLPYFHDEIILPRGMVQSIVSAGYYNSSNTYISITLADYANLITSNISANYLQKKQYVSWPLPISRIDAVQIYYVAGYPPTTTSDPSYTANIPEEIKTAIKFLVQADFDDLMADDRQAVVRHVQSRLAMLRLNWLC